MTAFFIRSTAVDEEVTIDSNVIRKVAKLLYLGYALSSGGGVPEAVTARIRYGWKKFKDIASVIVLKSCVIVAERKHV